MPPPYCYDHPRPAVTVDLVVFALKGDALRTLFIKRRHDPFAGRWALPGGFMEIEEPVEAAARRELREETGLELAGPVEFVGVFGNPGRDPRGRTISLVHAAVVPGKCPQVTGGDDAAEAAWLDPRSLRGLAFDHDQVLASALDWLAKGVEEGRLGLGLLPLPFRVKDVRGLHRAAALPEGQASRWLARLRRARRAVPVPGRKGWYQAERSASQRISNPIE
ncbi:MAG: NUDIX hydrolase [Isosphaeraceae bacterium]|nr:NUDIX hydrolase [Isosphaeraceae bacterium]